MHYHVYNFIFWFLSTTIHATMVAGWFVDLKIIVIWLPAEREFYNVTDLSWWIYVWQMFMYL